MPIHSIAVASDYAIKLLQSSSAGTVHSVYRNTVNLLLGEKIVALQCFGSPLSPLSLITRLDSAAMEALLISPKDPVIVKNDFITFCSGLVFNTAEAICENLELSGIRHPEQMEELTENCLCALRLWKGGSYALLFTDPQRVGNELFLERARSRLNDTCGFLRNRRWSEAGQALSQLLGLGIGLTPGGDDFLCGVLAGLTLCRLQTHPFYLALAHFISCHLDDTTRISAAFLRCALEGQYSWAINRLPYSVCPEETLEMFSQIGHSSGADTLSGLYFGLQIRSYVTMDV